MKGFILKENGLLPQGGKRRTTREQKFWTAVRVFLFFVFVFFFLPSSEVVFSTFCHQDIAIIANFGVQTKRPLKCSSESTATPYP